MKRITALDFYEMSLVLYPANPACELAPGFRIFSSEDIDESDAS